MKNVKKLLALLLAMTMLFALCACGDDTKKDDEKDPQTTQAANADPSAAPSTAPTQNNTNDEDDTLTAEKLEGDWAATLDLDAISYLMGEEVAIYNELGISLGQCTLDMTFANGEATLKSAGMVDWYVDMMEDVIDWCYEGDNMLKLVAKMMSTDGEEYTPADIEAMLAEEGSTIDDVLDEYFGEVDLEEMAAELAETVEDETKDYELNGDQLIFDDDSAWTISYSDGKIYVLSINEDGETYNFNKGDFVLEKK